MALRAISVGESNVYGLKNICDEVSSCRAFMGRTSKKPLSTFGRQLGIWILEAGFSSRGVFAKAIGMTPSNLSRLMRQRSAPGDEKLAAIAEALNRPLEEVIAAAHLRVDKILQPGKLIPSPTIPTRTEGSPMQEQIDQLLGAFGQVPPTERQRFVDEVSDLAASIRVRLRTPDRGHAGKRHRSPRTG